MYVCCAHAHMHTHTHTHVYAHTYCNNLCAHTTSYDGSNFVQEVGADFVIWELHGRSDFKYTTNAENVR